MQALLDPRVKKPVRHLVLSCKKEGDVFVTADTDIHTIRQAEKYLGRKGWKKINQAGPV